MTKTKNIFRGTLTQNERRIAPCEKKVFGFHEGGNHSKLFLVPFSCFFLILKNYRFHEGGAIVLPF